MNKTHALQNLLYDTASEEEIQLLKQLLASGEISIGGNVSNSVIIQGSENNVQVFQLTPEMLELLGGHQLLGNLERDLNGDEIALGLGRLEAELPLRAPVLASQFQEQARRLRPTLKTNPNALSESARKERLEALAHVNSLCVEALDISFNAVATGEALPEYEARCPFRGLESFRVEDSEFFFGREELTRKLVGKIQSHSFLAVLGSSGSGKSSLVMAGMIPALNLGYAVIRPGTNPLDALESAHGKSLLVVDQFEELFTLSRDEKIRADFISALLDFIKSGRVIITLRSDFLGEAGAYRSLRAEIQNHLEIIPPMNPDELRRAMEGQARWARLEFEADLSQQILDDVAGEPGAMPLLQHALWELWNRRHGRHLRANEYRAFGGVKQAITSTAEKVYGDCSKPEQEQVRDIFLRLTRLDEGDEGRDTRRRVPLGDLIPSGADTASISALLDKLADARLIVKMVNEDVTEIEVAHEALIRHWERLRIWLNEDRDNLRLRESVSESAKEWEKSGRHESLLNSRWVKLDEALLLAQDSRYRLTEIEQAYLKACIALRNREQRERERRLRYTVFASIAAAIIFLALAGFGWVKSNEATKQANIALARQLATQAQSVFSTKDSEQQTAVLLAIQSMRMAPTGESAQILQKNTLSKPMAQITHGGWTNSVAFSPDGKYVVSGGCDKYDSNICSQGSARVWEAASEKEVARVTYAGDVNSVAFSPDGKYVVSGGCDVQYNDGRCLGSARVWEVIGGKEVARIIYENGVSSLTFSRDGKYVISGGCDKFGIPCPLGSARVWGVESGIEITRIIHYGRVNSVAISPDGKYVFSGSWDGAAIITEVENGKEVFRLTSQGNVSSAEFSPDGKYVVFGNDRGTTSLWEIATGIEVSHMTNSFGSIISVAFSPDGKYVASGSSRTASVWEMASGKEVAHVNYANDVNSVAFSPDGRYVVSGSADHTARVWEAASGKEVARISYNSDVTSVAFSPDGKYVASGSWGVASVWKVASGNEIAHMIHDGMVLSVAFSPDGKYVVSGSADHSARVWEVVSGKEVARITYEGNDSWVDSVAFSPDGKYVVSGNETPEDNPIFKPTARVWEANSGREVARMTHDYWVSSVAFSPDGKYVVSGSVDHTARVWEAASGKEIARVTYAGEVNSVAFSPDGKYVVSGGCDKYDSNICSQGSARVWEAASGKEVARVTYAGDVNSVAFSPDGKYVASGSADDTARVWEVQTGKEVARMTHDGWVTVVAFSPDGKYVVSGSNDNTARVWDALTGKELARMIHDGTVTAVAFSPDGKYVVSGSADDTARVWEVQTGKEVARATYDSIVTSVAFSPNGRYVVSGSYDNTVRVWIYRPMDLITEACSRVTRNLTRAEWSQYIGDALPYQAVCPNLPIEPESTPTP